MSIWNIHIRGRVQGVGFRPFVSRLAQNMGLRGRVWNARDGVHLQLEADEKVRDHFLERLRREAPFAARIDQVEFQATKEDAALPENGLWIAPSASDSEAGMTPTPDLGLCAECRRELFDPRDRRYRYPFLSCTHCGPRFSILEGLPYDRPETSMAPFAMCASCTEEYTDSGDRRYHAQTNTCPDCPIEMEWWEADTPMPVDGQEAILDRCEQLLRAGKIVAVKGLGGFLLLADAANASAIQRLRKRKQRPHKPLALLVAGLEALHHAHLSNAEKRWLAAPESPIVLLRRKALPQHEAIPWEVLAPGLDAAGVMLPCAPLLALLASDFGSPLVATSANRSGEPIIHEGATMREHLGILCDAVLGHQRRIAFAQDDSLLRLEGEQPIVLRRARGFAPEAPSMTASQTVPDGLATGAEMKAAFALLQSGQLITAPYLGEGSHFGVQERYRQMLDDMLRLTGVAPEWVACDQHPDFFSSRLVHAWAQRLGLPRIEVQHHEAHLAALMGEHGIAPRDAGDLLGFVWDGTGLGPDGSIWGSECFRIHAEGFERLTPFVDFALAGGDALARSPRRAAQVLATSFGLDIRSLGWADEPTARITAQMVAQAKARHHSMGRFFDAAAFVILGQELQRYEGDAAMQLEQAAQRAWHQGHQAAFDTSTLDHLDGGRSLWRMLWESSQKGFGADRLALAFHEGLVAMIAARAQSAGARRLAFSGGVFQNALLVHMLKRRLGGDYTLYFHQRLSPNDENIALGQATWVQFFSCGKIAGHQVQDSPFTTTSISSLCV